MVKPTSKFNLYPTVVSGDRDRDMYDHRSIGVYEMKLRNINARKL